MEKGGAAVRGARYAGGGSQSERGGGFGEEGHFWGEGCNWGLF